MEIKNKLTVTKGRGREIMAERRGGVKSSMHKGPRDKDNGVGRIECGRRGIDRAGESNGGEMGTTVTEQLKKRKKKSSR